jgi:23S rRNA (uracil1939-C5)-methyltransferase
MSIILQNEMIKFTIDHLDPKAQGVFKEAENIFFIPSTLPGESGEALVYRKQKNLHFALPHSISQASPSRTKSSCPHFELCGGCHFLHTDYFSELAYKKKTLNFLTRKLNSPEILAVESDQRLGYRNRLQLHYDLNLKRLGLWSKRQDEIIEVPECLIAQPKIANVISSLYKDQSWIQFVKSKSKEKMGHIELYLKENEVSIAVNQSYAHLGFTQVHEKMNFKLREIVKKEFAALGLKDVTLFDLFGGEGNLTKELSTQQCLVIDSFPSKMPKNDQQNFIHLDLYEKNAAKKLVKWSGKNNFLILDPPRSGLKNISEFLQVLSVDTFFYVACDPHTFCRDLSAINETYQVTKLYLIDLFPSTYHFECFAVIHKRLSSSS